MRRRGFIAGILASCLFAPHSWAAGRKFHWRHPAVHPYRGTLEQALEAFGDLVPQGILDRFASMVKTGEGKLVDTIPQGFRFTRMLYGKAKPEQNVIAEVNEWPPEASRKITFYKIRDGGRVYVLCFPEVCGNWSVRILGIQGECIPCPDGTV